jgi:CMP-N,N'-diacetyllegionaminic acid synthase
MKVLGIIPARGGSKGIPKKNIKFLNCKPLIAYTIEAALQSKLDGVIVSTDCKEIASISRKYGAEVAIRVSELAQDDTPTLDALQYTVNKLDVKYDAIMTLQPTSPLRGVNHINEAIDIFKNDVDSDSLVSVVRVPHNFMPEKLMNFTGKYLTGSRKIKRRQEVENMFARNGAAIYITKIDKLDEYIFGGKVIPYFMKKIDSFDIDDMEDWEIVERLMQCVE